MDELAVDIPKAFTPWQVNRLRARLLIYYMSEHWSYAEYKRRTKLKPRGLIDASSRPRRPSYMTLAMDIETCPACERFVFAGDSVLSSPFVESARQDDGALISARSLQLFLGGDIKVDREGRQYRKFSTPDNTQNGRTKLAAIQVFLKHHNLIADEQFEDEGLRDFCLDLSGRFERSGIGLVNPLDYPLFDGDYVGEKEFEYGRVVDRLALHPTPASNRLHIYDPIYGVRCEELRFVRHHGESTAALACPTQVAQF